MKYTLFLIFLIFITSCNIWEEPEFYESEEHPVVCFNDTSEACGKESYLVPMPSSYVDGALPSGLTINFDPTTPFIVKMSAPIDIESISEENVVIIEDTQKLPFSDYKVTVDPKDDSLLVISHISGTWNEKSTYAILLLNKGLKSTKIGKTGKQLTFVKSKAWFLALSEFRILDKEGHSTSESLTDSQAQRMQALRDLLAPSLDKLTDFLKIDRFDILLLWSYKFRKPVVCFKEDISGCKDDQIPMPSDLMKLALPKNTHLNISNKKELTLKFSDPIDESTLDNNIIILETKPQTCTPETTTEDCSDTQNCINNLCVGKACTIDNAATECIGNEKCINNFCIKLGTSNVTNFETSLIDNNERLVITPKYGNWDSAASYFIALKHDDLTPDDDKDKKGIKTIFGDLVSNSKATFFSKQEKSLFRVLDMNNEKDKNNPLKLKCKKINDTLLINETGDLFCTTKAEYLPIFKTDLETPKALEELRLAYKPALDILKTLSVERENIVMFWSVTFDSDYIVPCFASPDSVKFPGCEEVTPVPLPSDFMMFYGSECSENTNEKTVCVENKCEKPEGDCTPGYLRCNSDKTVEMCFDGKTWASMVGQTCIPKEVTTCTMEGAVHHLDIPNPDKSPMIGGLNTLDGWSTSKPFTLNLSDDLDVTSIVVNTLDANLVVVKLERDAIGSITGATPVPIAITFNEDWNKLFISPLTKKWDETSTYLIIFKNSIRGKKGEKLVKSILFSLMSEEDSLIKEVTDKDGNKGFVSKYPALDDQNAKSLEKARLLFSSAYNALAGFGITRKDVAMMWTVTTQTVTKDMKNIALGIKANTLLPKVLTFSEVIEGKINIESHYAARIASYWMKGPSKRTPIPFEIDNVSKIALGTFKAPWMMCETNDENCVPGLLSPQKLSGEVTPNFNEIPIMVAFPQESQAIKANNKIIIYQHGINDAKEEVLPILNLLTGMGYIVISMDLPLHGERSICTNESGTVIDCVDLIDNFNPTRNEPDGVIDTSGEGYIGLNLFATRDLIRQSVIEQIILIKTLKEINFSTLQDSEDNEFGIKFSTIDSNNIKYFGFSLGTIIGNIFISLDDSIKSAILNVGGGVMTNIIVDTKESISGALFASLKSMGIEKGTKELDDFLYLAQTILDPADPINYSRKLISEDSFPILIQKSIGDPVMPNITTDDLATALGLIDPMSGDISYNYKSYQMDDFDPFRLYWHSFTMIPKSTAINGLAKIDISNFLTNN